MKVGAARKGKRRRSPATRGKASRSRSAPSSDQSTTTGWGKPSAERITVLSGPVIEAEGLELVDVQILGSSRRWIVRIVVDKPGGITVDECARVSRFVGDVLDGEEAVEGRYILEVSSPGLNRELKTARDFARCVGRDVHVWQRPAGSDAVREFVGRLEWSSATEIRLVLSSGEEVTSPLEEISKARLHI